MYALLNDGSIVVISTETNPGTVVSERRPEPKENLSVIESAITEFEHNFFLFGGTDAGQIVTLDQASVVRYSFSIQAHSASILDLKYNCNGATLFSLSAGKKFSFND